MKSIFDKQYWALHETAFELTQWPWAMLFEESKKSGLCIERHSAMLFSTTISPMPDFIKKDRSSFMLPKGKFKPELYGLAFETMFNKLKNAVDRGRLIPQQSIRQQRAHALR